MSPVRRRVAAHVWSIHHARVDPELSGSLKSQGFRRQCEGFCQARALFAASHLVSRSASKVVSYSQLGGQGSAHLSSPSPHAARPHSHLSQVQYLSSLPDDKTGKILSFTRGRGSKLTGTFDPEAWLRGPGSAVLERKLERERRPEPFGGPGKAEMGAEDGVLLPLTLPEGAPTAGSSAPSTS